MQLFPSRVVDGHTYVPAIDALRALAVMSVVLFHLDARLLPGGFVGVDVFFVISGYVVTNSMVRDAKLQFPAFVGAFYARRFKRIVPALMACLLLTVLAAEAFIPDAWISRTIPRTGLAAFYGFSNFVLAASEGSYFSTISELNPFTHTWSLAVEEQFYLLFPLLLYLCVRRDSGRLVPWAMMAFALSCVASLAVCAWATVNAPNKAYFLLYSRWWELGLGAAVSLLGHDRRQHWAQRCGPALMATVGALLIGVALIWAEKRMFPIPWALPAATGTAMLLISTAAGPLRGWPARLLTTGPVLWVGLMSYSLYLWHWPVFTLMRWTTGLDTAKLAATALLITLVLSWLSYVLVEMPVQRSVRVRQAPSPVVVACGVLVIACSWWIASQIQAKPEVFSQSVVQRNQVDWYPRPGPAAHDADGHRRCEVEQVNREPGVRTYLPRQCTGGELTPAVRLFVAGDSHVGAYERLMHQLAQSRGIAIWRFTQGGCPNVGLMKPEAAYDEDCLRFLAKTRETILRESRPGDVVLLASLRVERFIDQDGRPLSSDETATKPFVVPDSAMSEARRALQVFGAAGLQVVFELPKPVLKSLPFRCADGFNKGNPVCDAGFEMHRDFISAHRQPIVDAMMRLAAEFPEVSLWDPLPALCPTDRCHAFDHGRPLYFDSDHLSGHGNEVLLPSLASHLANLTGRRQ